MKQADHFPWTDVQIETLRTLHAEGQTFSQIATALGCSSRNAVIGKAGRLGLPKRGATSGLIPAVRSPRRPRSAPVPKRVPRQQFSAAPLVPVADGVCDLPPDSSPFACTLMDLRKSACRWPLGDPQGAETMFCGAGVSRGAYCARHGALAYAPPRTRAASDVMADARQRRRAHTEKLARAG